LKMRFVEKKRVERGNNPLVKRKKRLVGWGKKMHRQYVGERGREERERKVDRTKMGGLGAS